MSNELGKYLRKLRGERSLRDIAEGTGLSHTYISDIESGLRRGTKKPLKPSPETLKKLSDALDASYAELMILAGYWNEDELLTPIDVNKDMEELQARYQNTIKESPSSYVTEKELANIPIEQLIKYNLTFKGRTLTEDQKQHLAKLLQAAAEMLDDK